jgi:hypothetical protein
MSDDQVLAAESSCHVPREGSEAGIRMNLRDQLSELTLAAARGWQPNRSQNDSIALVGIEIAGLDERPGCRLIGQGTKVEPAKAEPAPPIRKHGTNQ